MSQGAGRSRSLRGENAAWGAVGLPSGHQGQQCRCSRRSGAWSRPGTRPGRGQPRSAPSRGLPAPLGAPHWPAPPPARASRRPAVAYVKFDRASSAAAAMEALNGAVLNDGRGPKLKVLLAEEPTQR